MPTSAEVLKKLKSLGKPSHAKTFARHGMKGVIYGVPFSELNKIAKQIKKNHELAQELWKSGVADARNLAIMIAEPARFTVKQANDWAKDFQDHTISDMAARVIAQSPSAKEIGEAWAKSSQEFVAAAGWVVRSAASSATGVPDTYFENLLDHIVHNIHQAPNRVRYAMNNAVIAIGIKNAHLQKLALDAAKKIGKVEVDHGDTACKTPDAAEYIKKTVARKHGRAKRAGC
jgi:3-methyladenine DNA glycosylase AlkD